MPDAEEGIRARQDNGAPVDLRQRRQEKRPDGVAEQENADGQGGFGRVRGVEIRADGIDCRGEDGR